MSAPAPPPAPGGQASARLQPWVFYPAVIGGCEWLDLPSLSATLLLGRHRLCAGRLGNAGVCVIHLTEAAGPGGDEESVGSAETRSLE